MKSNVIKFPRRPEAPRSDADEPVHDDGGDGGGPDIIIKVVIVGDEREVEEPVEEPRRGGVAAFCWGALAGLLLGG